MKDKIIAAMLAKLKTWAEEDHDIVETAVDNGSLEHALYQIIDELAQGLAWDKDLDQMDKQLHKMSATTWEKLFKEKYNISSLKLVTDLEKKELAALPENTRKFLECLGYHLVARPTPTDIRSGSAQFSYYMRSPKNMVIQGWGMQGAVFQAEGLAKFQLDFKSAEALFTSWGVKISKRPKPFKYSPPLYD